MERVGKLEGELGVNCVMINDTVTRVEKRGERARFEGLFDTLYE